MTDRQIRNLSIAQLLPNLAADLRPAYLTLDERKAILAGR